MCKPYLVHIYWVVKFNRDFSHGVLFLDIKRPHVNFQPWIFDIYCGQKQFNHLIIQISSFICLAGFKRKLPSVTCLVTFIIPFVEKKTENVWCCVEGQKANFTFGIFTRQISHIPLANSALFIFHIYCKSCLFRSISLHIFPPSALLWLPAQVETHSRNATKSHILTFFCCCLLKTHFFSNNMSICCKRC